MTFPPILKRDPKVASVRWVTIDERSVILRHKRDVTVGGNFQMILIALLIGVIAGLRTMTAPAAVSWAASMGILPLQATWLWWLGAWITPYIFTVLALGELITDKLPSTPSRKIPMQFGGRLISGALCGAAVGFAGGSAIAGAVAGVIGAAIGTYGGAAMRARLAQSFGSDRPAALTEDAIAVIGAVVLMALAR